MDKSDLKILLPTTIETVSLLTFSLFAMLLLNVNHILGTALGDEVQPQTQEVFTILIQDYFLEKLSIIINASLATFMFWFLLVLVALTAIQFGRWLYRQYRNDATDKKLVNAPSAEVRKRFIIIHALVRSIAVVSIVFWFVLLFTVVLPLLSSLFTREAAVPLQFVASISSVVILAVYLYIVLTLIRLLVLRRQIFQ